MKMLPARQKQVVAFLERRDWTSPTEIGRAVWGPGHHSATASPVCKRLVEGQWLERNEQGHYRIIRQDLPDPERSQILDELTALSQKEGMGY